MSLIWCMHAMFCGLQIPLYPIMREGEWVNIALGRANLLINTFVHSMKIWTISDPLIRIQKKCIYQINGPVSFSWGFLYLLEQQWNIWHSGCKQGYYVFELAVIYSYSLGSISIWKRPDWQIKRRWGNDKGPPPHHLCHALLHPCPRMCEPAWVEEVSEVSIRLSSLCCLLSNRQNTQWKNDPNYKYVHPSYAFGKWPLSRSVEPVDPLETGF